MIKYTIPATKSNPAIPPITITAIFHDGNDESFESACGVNLAPELVAGGGEGGVQLKAASRAGSAHGLR